ncbi:Alkaline phosphatase [hydrothermal vent metagenome]|uniref:Alkaline phosphatase n=1 Tax=hydrothermal vent metagenome TaxID=652676 RepID=A0A3B0SXJ2_9ZZZZ
MELNNSVSVLFKFAASANALQAKQAEAPKEQKEHSERSEVRRASFEAPSSKALRSSYLAQRVEKMSNALARLQQTVPSLSDASTTVVERARGEASVSFAYSLTQDKSGNVTEQFTFKIQFKAAGDAGFTQVGASPAPANDAPANTTPAAVPAPQTQTPAPQTPAPQTGDAPPVAVDPSAAPQTGDQAPKLTVAQLIEYYRIDTVAAPAAAPAGTDAPEAVEEAGDDKRGHDEVKQHRNDRDNSVKIDASRVSRVSTGAGDDVVEISADNVRRIRTGGGDDTLTIDANRVTRINTGAGDDVLNINADNVARIRTGAGDDTVNIEADRVRRVNTGAGDDILNINADKVTRINTGEGDDTLTINADTITRVNTGAGDDTLVLTADTIGRVNAGAGDDTITLDAVDAAIAFGKGGGQDVINITSVGALAIQIDSELAASLDDVSIVEDGENIVLEFASGESLTLNNVGNADIISLQVGGESIDLRVSEPPVALDLSV